MKNLFVLLLTVAALPLMSEPLMSEDWTPQQDVAKAQGLAVSGRTLELFTHGVKSEWGYAKPQQDTFVVVHPKVASQQAPLYVVLHSAGHDVISCVKCTAKVGDHDIYHSPEDFYAQLSSALGIAKSQCINMYGMTELSTQFYDDGSATLPSVKSGPHWIRTRVLEPLSGQELPTGQQGILAHCDLANFNSVTTILTEDVGVAVDGGFLLLGRAEGSAAKGCSLAVEEFLQAARA